MDSDTPGAMCPRKGWPGSRWVLCVGPVGTEIGRWGFSHGTAGMAVGGQGAGWEATGWFSGRRDRRKGTSRALRRARASRLCGGIPRRGAVPWSGPPGKLSGGACARHNTSIRVCVCAAGSVPTGFSAPPEDPWSPEAPSSVLPAEAFLSGHRPLASRRVGDCEQPGRCAEPPGSSLPRGSCWEALGKGGSFY